MSKIAKAKWKNYYKQTANKPASPLLSLAIEKNDYNSGIAYDLGCGVGQDSLFLAEHSWKVIAVDKEEEALNTLNCNNKTNITTLQSSFESLQLNKCHLINGSFSFPFCNPEYFNKFWNNMRVALMPGGTISGHLFGINDEWAKFGTLSFHSQSDWDLLLRDCDVVYFDEIEERLPTALGELKHWHIYSFVLKKLV